MIGPSNIIPLVDQAGIHVEFDRWVIGAICHQMKMWSADGVPVPVVAATVWSETLRRPDALRLVDALAETGVDPTTIELECPRGSTVDPEVTKALVAIKALGVRLASEEYATGARPRWIVSFDTFKIPYPISRDHVAHADAIVAAPKRGGSVRGSSPTRSNQRSRNGPSRRSALRSCRAISTAPSYASGTPHAGARRSIRRGTLPA